jgi:hypothetical protein
MTRSLVRVALPLLGLVGCVGCTRLARPLDPLVADERLLTLVTGHSEDELSDPAVRREIQRNWRHARQNKQAFVELSVLSRMQALAGASTAHERAPGPLGPGLDTADTRAVVPPSCAAPAITQLWFTSSAHPWLPAPTNREVYEIVNEAVACSIDAERLADPHAVMSARVALWAWARTFAPAFASSVDVDVDLTDITDPWVETVQLDLDRGCLSAPGGTSTDEEPEHDCLVGCRAEMEMGDESFAEDYDDNPLELVWGECPSLRQTEPTIGISINPAPVTGHNRTMTLAQIGQLEDLLSRATTDERRDLELQLARLWIAVELGETDPRAANAAGWRALNLLLAAVNATGGSLRRWDEALLLTALVAWRMDRMWVVTQVLQRLSYDSGKPTTKHVGLLLFGDLYCREGHPDVARDLWARAAQDADAGLVAAAHARQCAVPDSTQPTEPEPKEQ